MDDSGEFAHFVRANTPALTRTAYLLCGDKLGAEELVQDTLVRLYSKWQLVAAADAPLAYVRRSLANQFVNQSRRPSRREITVETMPERAETHDPAGQFDDREELWAMLGSLPARQRAALVLRYFHDLPDEEIGAALGCQLGTVRSLISRGLAALRDHAAASEGVTVRRLA
jgi:RNA polymerase sigma-70 factor (sigma-E family)